LRKLTDAERQEIADEGWRHYQRLPERLEIGVRFVEAGAHRAGTRPHIEVCQIWGQRIAGAHTEYIHRTARIG
jgi:hypothetical protein